MELKFEPTRSFCYQFGRYTVLAEVQLMPEVISGNEFRLTDLAQQVIDKVVSPNSAKAQPRLMCLSFLDVGK